MDTPTKRNKHQHLTLNIGGMGCSGCANTVKDALSNLDGVQEVNVDLTSHSASVRFNAEVVSTNDFKKAVEAAGYGFEGIK